MKVISFDFEELYRQLTDNKLLNDGYHIKCRKINESNIFINPFSSAGLRLYEDVKFCADTKEVLAYYVPRESN